MSFLDIYEELDWTAFKMTGTPDIARDMINRRYKTPAKIAQGDKGKNEGK